MEKTIALLGVQWNFSIALLESGTFYSILGDHNQPIEPPEFIYIYPYINHQGTVVQSWVSTNPGLKFNPLFCFCISTHLFTLKLGDLKIPSI